jgi:alcohol dehydrogenase (cytochrome c)
MFDPEYRPGDNLYTNSAIALHIDTGELAWYFQYTPNESWDYDEQGIHMLVNSPFNGEDRLMVVHFGRNGYFYQLDRTNGAFISGTQYVQSITWTAGLDPKTGLPVEYDPALTLQEYIPATRWHRADTMAEPACPQLPGGVRWQTPAVNPVTMVAYVSGEDGCQNQFRIPSIRLANGQIDEQGRNVPGAQIPGGAPAAQDFQGLLAAVDLTTGNLLHRIHIPFDGQAGVTATAGGIIVIPWGDGSIRVYNDETLEELWAFYTGAGVRSPVSSFEIDGKQYLATIAGAQQVNRPELGVRGWGSTLYVFTLGPGAPN